MQKGRRRKKKEGKDVTYNKLMYIATNTNTIMLQ
jgi:hypothetical protein